MKFTTEQWLIIRNIIVFYQSRHMSIKNPQHKEVNEIIDRITKELSN